jgi:hypothetical protein
MLYVSYATSVSTLLPLLRLKFFYLASDGYCSYLNFLMTDFGLLLMMRLDCLKFRYKMIFVIRRPNIKPLFFFSFFIVARPSFFILA